MDIGAKQAWGETLPFSEADGCPAGVPLQVGLLGVGRWGGNLLRVLRSSERIELRDWADLRAGSLESEVGGSGRRTLDELLTQPKVEAIVIATPSEMHFEHASQALRAGRHVLVEKPLAHSVDEAEELCVLASRHRVQLMVGHILRYHPAIATILALLQSGELGRPTRFVSERMIARRSSEDLWWCLAPHDLSLAELLLGQPLVRVACHDQRGIACCRIATSDGIRGEVHVGRATHKSSRFELECEQGSAAFNPTHGHVQVTRRGRRFELETPRREPLRLELEHFAACVRSGVKPLTDGSEGLRVVRALAAGDRSRRLAGRWQDV